MPTSSPLGVGNPYSWRRSGWLGGHLLVIGKSSNAVIGGSSSRVGVGCSNALPFAHRLSRQRIRTLPPPPGADDDRTGRVAAGQRDPLVGSEHLQLLAEWSVRTTEGRVAQLVASRLQLVALRETLDPAS